MTNNQWQTNRPCTSEPKGKEALTPPSPHTHTHARTHTHAQFKFASDVNAMSLTVSTPWFSKLTIKKLWFIILCFNDITTERDTSSISDKGSRCPQLFVNIIKIINLKIPAILDYIFLCSWWSYDQPNGIEVHLHSKIA